MTLLEPLFPTFTASAMKAVVADADLDILDQRSAEASCRFGAHLARM
jgi:hypothetical protein